MSRKNAIKMLDDLVNQAQGFVELCDNQEYGFWAICHAPEIAALIEEELRPWYSSTWEWLKSAVCGLRRTSLDDEIPF